MNGLWQRAGDRMRDELGQVGFETWIGPLNFVAHQGSTVTVHSGGGVTVNASNPMGAAPVVAG